MPTANPFHEEQREIQSTVRIPIKVKTWLDKIASKHGIATTRLIRGLVAEWDGKYRAPLDEPMAAVVQVHYTPSQWDWLQAKAKKIGSTGDVIRSAIYQAWERS